MSRTTRALLGATFAMLAAAVDALPMPTGELERRCWQRYTPERTQVNVREPTAVEFANLRQGYRLRSPFVVDFGIRGMGVVPTGKALAGTGHHHVLVDTALPTDIRQQIPFNDGHRHFGKGQTFTVLDLPRGKHRLRLLFADHEHRPYFVFSPEITVDVVGPRTATPPRIEAGRFDETCARWYEDEVSRPRPPGEYVSIVNLREGEQVTSPFVARFGVDGWGVCAAGQTAERTGVFLLEIVREGRVQRTVDLSAGATQTTLALPNGNHLLRLRFVNAATQRDLMPSSETPVVVSAQARL